MNEPPAPKSDELVTACCSPSGKIFYTVGPVGPEVIRLAIGPHDALRLIIDRLANRPAGRRRARTVPGYRQSDPEEKRRAAVESFRAVLSADVRQRLRTDLEKIVQHYSRFAITPAPGPEPAPVVVPELDAILN